jgi:hypothetical protein
MTPKNEELEGMVNGYRRQGHFWRFTSLLQIPLIFVLTIYFISRYLHADTLVRVAEPAIPGDTRPEAIPQKEYINVAQDITNLIGTYQPTTVRDQFETAREFFLDSALKDFDETQMNTELVTAEESDISQLLTIESTRFVKGEKRGDAQVCLFGFRQKIVERQPLPHQSVSYCFSFVVEEPFEENPFGIVVAAFVQRLGSMERMAVPSRISPKFEKSKKASNRKSLRHSRGSGKKAGKKNERER